MMDAYDTGLDPLGTGYEDELEERGALEVDPRRIPISYTKLWNNLYFCVGNSTDPDRGIVDVIFKRIKASAVDNIDSLIEEIKTDIRTKGFKEGYDNVPGYMARLQPHLDIGLEEI